MRTRRDPQSSFYARTNFIQQINLLNQHGGINDHATTDQPYCVGREKPGWHKMNLECSKLIDDGMPGVVTAIEACHIIHVLGEKIHCLAFAFIAPLCPNYCCDCHKTSDI